jgi:hypothetical protein
MCVVALVVGSGVAEQAWAASGSAGSTDQTSSERRPQGVDARNNPLQANGTAASSPSAGFPITREEIVARAKTWLAVPVPYSQDVFRGGYRTDCSGYVSMAWHTNGNFWTGDLATIGTPIAFNDLRAGDMLLYHNPSNPTNGSHVVLFDRWVGPVGGDFWMYEQTPPNTMHRRWSDTSGRNLNNYKPYSYVKVLNSVPGNADVNGDGLSDLVAQNETDTWVRLSNGSSFYPPAQWSSVAFYGAVANRVGDVTGDGRSDLIAFNGTDTWVMAATSTHFSSPLRWSGASVMDAVDVHVGDVSGDGLADLVVQKAGETWVMTSTGWSFNAPVRWSAQAFYGEVANHIGDVNGDGRADLIAQNSTDVWVMTSAGFAFNAPVRWSSVAFYGGVGNHIGDVNGDGRADLIAQNGTYVFVMTSNGSSFDAPSQWSSVAFYGGVANHVGDVNGDGYADLVAQNYSDVYAMTSNGGWWYSQPALWGTGAFSAHLVNHG